MSCAKTAELIKMPFRLWIRAGSRKHVLHGGADSPWNAATFREERVAHCKV